MKMKLNNPFDLEAEDQEKITVKVQSTGTVHLVTYTLDGGGGVIAKNKSLTFVLEQNKHDPSLLRIVFTFADSKGDGGSYKVEVTGSMGGDVSRTTVKQTFGIPVDSKLYVFDVW